MIDSNCGVYAIRAPSGKLYIGSTVNFRRRWSGHRNRLARGTHHCPGLQAAFHKYGLDALVFCVLALVPKSDLIAVEQAFIEHYDGQLYNVCPVAGSRLGRGQSAETREKIRAFQLGKKRSDETKARMAAAQRGRCVSAETREKIGALSRGRKQSAPTRAKRGAALKGRTHKDNATGFTGVGPFRGRFRARWENKHLGVFDSPEAAYAAVCAARDAGGAV